MFSLRRQMRLLLAHSAFSSFAIAGASWVALLAARGFSPIEIGLAESCFHVASLLFEIPSGAAADVFGRKRCMVVSACLFIASSLMMAASVSLPGICFALMLNAWGYNFASGTREALAYDSLLCEGQEAAYMRYSSTELIIYRLGGSAAALGAGFALAIGYRRANLLDALLGLLALLTALLLRETPGFDRIPMRTAAARTARCLRESLAFLRRSPRADVVMLVNAAVGAVATLLQFFLQSALREAGLADAFLGPALFLLGLGGAIGAHLSPRFARWRFAALAALCGGGVLLGLLLGLSGVPLAMLAGGLLASALDDCLQVYTDAMLNDLFPSSERATLISVSSMLFSLVMIGLSPLVGAMFG